MNKIPNPKDIIKILEKEENELTIEEKIELHSFTIATLANDMKLVLDSLNILDNKLKDIENKFKN